MSIVVCKLPKAGLGNQLFPLMKAYTFAHINSLPVIITGYKQFFIGPYLRGEKSKRKYNHIFIFQKSIFPAYWEKWKLLKYKSYHQQIEPSVAQVEITHASVPIAFIFFKMPHWDHYFDGLKDHRALVISFLWKLLLPGIREKALSGQSPYIGIHIRMGDFRKLREGEIFGRVGAVRTPEKYFINLVSSIRAIHGSNLPVSVFSDGFKDELKELFQLSNIQMVAGNNDMVDLLLLSKSKIIITSAGSTFSYWAAFLSDAAVIMHPEHIHTSLRPENLKETLYEGAFDITNPLLIKSIQQIKYF